MTREKVLSDLKSALTRPEYSEKTPRPWLPLEAAIPDPQAARTQFSEEISKLSGETAILQPGKLDDQLNELVKKYTVKKAAIWNDEHTQRYGLSHKLAALGVQVVSPDADKYVLANCDLGITSVDFAIPATGTIGLISSAQKPRAVSLLPRVHLAIIEDTDFRPNLTSALQEFKNHRYLTLISGPSRTSDIELILTLGVHGPQFLVAWLV
jgi:L-lactate dehydrogenase complex protein LldG